MKGPGEDEMWLEWRGRPRDCSNTDEIYDQDNFESLLQSLIKWFDFCIHLKKKNPSMNLESLKCNSIPLIYLHRGDL